MRKPADGTGTRGNIALERTPATYREKNDS